MLTAIQSQPSASSISQATAAPPANLARSLALPASSTVNLGNTETPLTYNASGLFNTASSSPSAAASRSDAAANGSEEIASSTDRLASLPSLAPATGLLRPAPGTPTTSTPAPPTDVVAPGSSAANSPSAIAEVVNPAARNTTSDSAMQAVVTVTQNPAYPHLVASQYLGMAAAMAQTPLVVTPPIKLDESKPVMAIPAITALGKLGAESGRDGNPALAYRQRKTNSWRP